MGRMSDVRGRGEKGRLKNKRFRSQSQWPSPIALVLGIIDDHTAWTVIGHGQNGTKWDKMAGKLADLMFDERGRGAKRPAPEA